LRTPAAWRLAYKSKQLQPTATGSTPAGDHLFSGYAPEIPPAGLRNFVAKSQILIYDYRYSNKQISDIDMQGG